MKKRDCAEEMEDVPDKSRGREDLSLNTASGSRDDTHTVMQRRTGAVEAEGTCVNLLMEVLSAGDGAERRAAVSGEIPV
ncbi:hypothetical protein Q8A67_020380 [Cirrhinus molitorella]|uniref:Uncharacterized protein n=1 Tax=Cirrhinus molitorella TaxID=172907 RepID=A0AA88PCI8_9TELE|nr:hypothetical protein Q8A67_020380 [Cirrhinus molitorella]